MDNKKKQIKKRFKAGETLVEVLVSVLIITLSVTILATILFSTHTMRKASEERYNQYITGNNDVVKQVDYSTKTKLTGKADVSYSSTPSKPWISTTNPSDYKKEFNVSYYFNENARQNSIISYKKVD